MSLPVCESCGLLRFRQAGELALPVGVMPFKGLSQHADDLEECMDGLLPETCTTVYTVEIFRI